MTLMMKCKAHWKKLGIKNELTLMRYIESLFEKHTQQDQVLIDIYKMVLPEWDNIKIVHGHPKVGNELWKFICRCFLDFDRKYHPNVMHSGIWFNTGFSACSDIGPWEISFDDCAVEYVNDAKEVT